MMSTGMMAHDADAGICTDELPGQVMLCQGP